MPPLCHKNTTDSVGILQSPHEESARWLQDTQRRYLENSLPEDMLCAYVNNNMRCYNESTEFAELMEDSLAPSFQVLISQARI